MTDPAAPTLWLGDDGALRLLLAAATNAGGGWRKQGTPRCRLRRKACSTSFGSEAGSIRQKDPFPGSSWERGTLTKYRFRDRLWRMEFWESVEQ